MRRVALVILSLVVLGNCAWLFYLWPTFQLMVVQDSFSATEREFEKMPIVHDATESNVTRVRRSMSEDEFRKAMWVCRNPYHAIFEDVCIGFLISTSAVGASIVLLVRGSTARAAVPAKSESLDQP